MLNSCPGSKCLLFDDFAEPSSLPRQYAKLSLTLLYSNLLLMKFLWLITPDIHPDPFSFDRLIRLGPPIQISRMVP
ncbi:unnamed protein product [Protopolystoma xenopodis]|uniref:Uncharacterized protein n=1 Tax=Protopolystoma xenopodis TaxID=117903 RepID=A0A448WBW1_9PLAT|nr:unnamed protein product [Protopolystoma xenopodis]